MGQRAGRGRNPGQAAWEELEQVHGGGIPIVIGLACYAPAGLGSPSKGHPLVDGRGAGYVRRVRPPVRPLSLLRVSGLSNSMNTFPTLVGTKCLRHYAIESCIKSVEFRLIRYQFRTNVPCVICFTPATMRTPVGDEGIVGLTLCRPHCLDAGRVLGQRRAAADPRASPATGLGTG